MPTGLCPFAFSSLNTFMAFGTPLRSVSYVSTSSMQLSGKISAYARNASSSLGKLITQLCACVPDTGTPHICPVSTLLVPVQPPIIAARAPYMPASGPCARLRPNSITPSPFAAYATRAALVAISV